MSPQVPLWNGKIQSVDRCCWIDGGEHGTPCGVESEYLIRWVAAFTAPTGRSTVCGRHAAHVRGRYGAHIKSVESYTADGAA